MLLARYLLTGDGTNNGDGTNETFIYIYIPYILLKDDSSFYVVMDESYCQAISQGMAWRYETGYFLCK